MPNEFSLLLSPLIWWSCENIKDSELITLFTLLTNQSINELWQSNVDTSHIMTRPMMKSWDFFCLLLCVCVHVCTKKYVRDDDDDNDDDNVPVDSLVHCTAKHDPPYIRQLRTSHNVWDETKQMHWCIMLIAVADPCATASHQGGAREGGGGRAIERWCVLARSCACV